MTEHYVIEPKGVCAMEISYDIEDGILRNVKFEGGCTGNAAGVARICEGRPAKEVVKRLRGIICRGDTSCPDQLARSIEEALSNEEAEL